MSTAIEPPPHAIEDRVTRIELPPRGLDAFLATVRRLPGRLRYSDGSLTLVSPSIPHEENHELIHDLIELICDELDIDYTPTSSTLFVRDDLDKGVEPDQSYYIANQGAIAAIKAGARHARGVDLRRYPPPDLAVEVVWAHPAGESLAIYAALGVPEVWVHNIAKGELRFLLLDEAGAYTPGPRSRAFPFLSVDDVLGQLRSHDEGEPHNIWKRRLREWVRETLGPRRGG